MQLNKNFILLITGQSLASIGDVLYMVGIISTIFALTGSATAASFVPFTITSSMFLSSLLTPLVMGKVNLKWLLTGSQLGKTGLIVVLGLFLSGISGANYYLVFLVISGIAFLDGCANPIKLTMIPQYVEPERLVRANGVAETISQFIQTVMWFVGSLFLIFMDVQQLIWVVSLMFALSSIMMFLLDNVKHQRSKQEKKLDRIKVGWKTLFDVPVLRKIAYMEVLETVAATVWIAAILYVFVSDALHVDEKWWGFINGSFFLGLIIGSIYCIKYSSLVERKLAKIIFIGSLSSFFITILFSATSNPMIALLLAVGIGLFGQLKSIPQQTVIQTSVAKEKLSTVYTSLGAISTGIFGISSLGMGILADLFGVRCVFLVSGLMLAIVTLIVYKNKHLFVRNIME
ncbi:MFS transporter [Sporosarcina newyorkensis]|uniref:MFS transporter n=1 Tax=Sporosarcina newyorkensis TaxID=759851 RepID=UPI0005951472|nr:MFS transporter [Sporosarcina newyorkensis]